MADTLSTIIAKTRFWVKEPSPGFFTGPDILVAINDGFAEIGKRVLRPKTCYSAYVASGDRYVTLSSNFICVDEDKGVAFADGSGTRELTAKDVTSIGKGTYATTTPGSPANYYEESESRLGLHPPCISGCINAFVITKPGVLVSADDTNELTDRCGTAVAKFAAAECQLKDGNSDRYAALMLGFESDAVKLIDDYDMAFRVDKDIEVRKN
jgi:hypothetical protein